MNNESAKAKTIQRAFIIILHSFIGWALCAAIIGIGFQLTTEQNTLIIHALGVPVVFGLLSWNYFKRFSYTSPLKTAIIFLGFVAFMDFFLVAMVIQRSFLMFLSLLGTWIPFFLIFATTYFVGKKVSSQTRQ